ncbi:MAG: hypothetical protein IJ844_07810 [Prevotella sp.]|nr:hypothetical protein [Prevotella sp.]
MKRLTLTAFALLTAMGASAQYQLPNPGFEQWDGGSESEPTHWNSFASSDGSYAGLASSPHHYRRNGGRPGTNGNHYLTVYTKSILGIKANGNMTTGRIHAGSMSATSSENYNYTQRSNTAHCQPFSGTPDSMYVWVSFYAASGSSIAQVSAVLHGDSDFRSPIEEGTPSKYCGKASAEFTRTTTSATTMQWRQMKVPFVYDGSATAAYMLVNITSNKTPGSGSGNDSLSVDDIEFIYSSWLGSINIGGEPIESFDKGQLNYSIRVADTAVAVGCETEVSDATVSMSREAMNDSSVLVSLVVTAEDGESTHTYTVLLTAGEPAPTTGIAEAEKDEEELRVYPNPTKDRVRIEATGEVCLMDLGGREIGKYRADGAVSICLGQLPAGTYIVRCGKKTTKIVRS